MDNESTVINDKTAEALQKMARSTKDLVKTAMFDIAGIAVILVSAFIALNVLDFNEQLFESWENFLVSFVPFWIASWLLDDNYYTKGLFKAKQSEKYAIALKSYSERAEKKNGSPI